MRIKTYRNFMRVWNTLQKEHGYEKEEARKLAHHVFENVEADKGYGNHTAEYFLAKILPAEEFYAQY
jgi:hypothetical protein